MNTQEKLSTSPRQKATRKSGEEEFTTEFCCPSDSLEYHTEDTEEEEEKRKSSRKGAKNAKDAKEEEEEEKTTKKCLPCDIHNKKQSKNASWCSTVFIETEIVFAPSASPTKLAANFVGI